jgi:hypothetical protein
MVKQKHIWVTKEGVEIPIEEMTDSHLLNCIGYAKMMKDKHRTTWRPLLIEAVKKEAEKRGLTFPGRWYFEF